MRGYGLDVCSPDCVFSTDDEKDDLFWESGDSVSNDREEARVSTDDRPDTEDAFVSIEDLL